MRWLCWIVLIHGAGLEAAAPDYLGYVTTFADTLLTKGADRFGSRHTALWAGVIDARSMTVPEAGTPPPRGVRPHDRAVGGCNLYHDAVTIRVFRALSEVTGQPRYRDAALAYMRDFLALAQNPRSGLLAWGEHLYYDLFKDRVAAERAHHELLEWTPPWPELWEANPEAVARAIAGLRFHFYEDNPQALYNRHANWDSPTHQKPGGQPWIKHSGLYAYSFMFLFSKTREQKWLEWARGAGALYWNHRNKETNLTLGCIGDPRPTSSHASSQAPELAYWLFKAWELAPEEKAFRDRALILTKAYYKYFFDPAQGAFRGSVALDGKPLSEATSGPWNIAYGQPGILPNGRIAAYLARKTGDAQLAGMAKQVHRIARQTPLPEGVSIEGIAFALNLSLDLYDLTKESGYLRDAQHDAAYAVEHFWRQGPGGALFVRQAGDSFYEAKTGAGDLLAGLLRLHLRLNPKLPEPKAYDWSF